MAKKYIDADRLKQTIADNVYPVQDAFNSRDYGMFWTDGIEKAIDEQPAADVQEVRRGRWLYKSELYSYCGHPFYPKICSVCNGVFEYTTNYCPSCGARMEVE